MNVKSKKLLKSQIELEFELTADEFKEHMAHALEHLKHHVKVDGFRPGKAPASMVEDKLKPEALLMEAGDHAVQHVYVDYIKESKLEPVGNPEVSIVKIAQGSPFIFKAIITVLPDVELPDYQKIAKTVKGKEISVTEEEIQDSLNYLQRTRAKFTAHNNPAALRDFVEIKYSMIEKAAPAGASLAQNGREINDKFVLGEAGFMNGFEAGIVGMKAGEEKEVKIDLRGKESVFKIKLVSVQKMDLPEINDEFAKQLGSFDTLVALKNSMKEGITAEKQEAEKQRKRGEILEKIAEKAKFSAPGGPASGGELPEAIIEQEQQRLLHEFKHRVEEAAKISFEEYLASVKKTEVEIKETYKKEAEKRLRGFLVLRELGKLEKIEVSEKEVEEEVNKAPKNQTLRQAQGKFDINELKEYTKGVIQNEKVFQKLELYSI